MRSNNSLLNHNCHDCGLYALLFHGRLLQFKVQRLAVAIPCDLYITIWYYLVGPYITYLYICYILIFYNTLISLLCWLGYPLFAIHKFGRGEIPAVLTSNILFQQKLQEIERVDKWLKMLRKWGKYRNSEKVGKRARACFRGVLVNFVSAFIVA